MAKDGIKQIIFIILIIVIIAVVAILWTNSTLIIDNLLAVVVILFILFIVARYDFIIQLKDYERAVVFTLGRVSRVGGPGWALIFPPFESYTQVDLRTRTIDIPRQEIFTKDNIEVTIDAVIYLKINKDDASVINSVTEVVDYIKASRLFVVGLIRDKAGSLELNELISQVDQLNEALKTDLERLATKWGVVVEEATIKDVKIPKTVLQSMHEQKAAVQHKLARMEGAKAKQAEIEAVKAAAKDLDDKTLAFYYIKALEKLGEGKSTKFIFPMELTKLASSLSGKDMSHDDIGKLLKKYGPLVKELSKKKD